jgi:uncharacterized protein (DUF1697 family)
MAAHHAGSVGPVSSTTWVALLRGINVGGNKMVPMADLRTLLGSLGYGSARTHLQSGNAIFTTAGGKAAAVEREIAARIEADMGLDVHVIVRSSKELGAIVDANPFLDRGAVPKELHCVFLSAAPSLQGIDPGGFAPDEFEAGDRVLYVRLPNGVMASRLPNWERVLGLTATMRTWNTVTRLRELADAA